MPDVWTDSLLYYIAKTPVDSDLEILVPVSSLRVLKEQQVSMSIKITQLKDKNQKARALIQYNYGVSIDLGDNTTMENILEVLK